MSTMPGLLDKERIVASPGFNRWLIPPAALAIHLCIGMAYGFSVFWLPLSRAVGSQGRACAPGTGMCEPAYHPQLRLAGVHAGLDLHAVLRAPGLLGGAVRALAGDRRPAQGRRRVGAVLVRRSCDRRAGRGAAPAVAMWLGAGVIGGIGLGLGYISPVSTLIKWFPDRRGMSTGMAIMGFGGGAMIGAPLADLLMKHFAGPAQVGVWQTFLVMAAPIPGRDAPGCPWLPDSADRLETGGLDGACAGAQKHGYHATCARDRALRTPQFWLLWGVLCLNVSAGIGVVGMASPDAAGGLWRAAAWGHAAAVALADSERAQVATIRPPSRDCCPCSISWSHLLGLLLRRHRPQGNLF